MEMLLIGVGAFVIACVAGAASLNRKPYIRRILHRAIRTDIRQARENVPLAISGVVELVGAGVIAPLTGQRCAAYDVDIMPDDGSVYVSRVRDRRGTDFVVRDGTGKARIRWGQGLTVQLFLEKNGRSRCSRRIDGPSAELRALLERARAWERERAFSALLVLELVLVAGAQVVVCGVGRWEADPDPDPDQASYRDAPRVLEIFGDGRTSLVVADDARLIHECRTDDAAMPHRVDSG